LGRDEGRVGAVVEAQDFAVVDAEGELVAGVFDGEGDAGLQQGVEFVEAVLEGDGMALLGPGG